MGAAAELVRPVTDRHDSNLVAVLLAEQRHRTHRSGLGLAHEVRRHRKVVEEYLVNPCLDLLQDARGDRCRTREVEPQPTRGVLRAHLGGGIAESLAEGPVDEVGRGVRPGNSPASLDVDLGHHGLALCDLAARHLAAMNEQSRNGRLHVEYLDDRALPGKEPPMVTELAAGLGVERRAVQDDLDVLARTGRRHRLAIADEANDLRFG